MNYVCAGGVLIGGGAPVTVQSMTNTDTRDAEKTLAQVMELCEAGAEIVRVSVFDEAAAAAMKKICADSPVPIVADIHFDYRLAIKSIEAGVAKVRINPGNIGCENNVRILADCLKAHKIPVRIGVNSGSIEREILRKFGPTPEGMAESALNHARMLEKCGFFDIVLSAKASNVMDTIRVNRLLRERCEYPLHIGVTEAGEPGMGTIKGAIGIGALLADGIGDTIRVSLTGDPVREVEAGLMILKALGLRREGVDIIACPTCGRTSIDVAGIVSLVRRETKDIRRPLKVAVMGCVVNGPGEAREADIGIAGGRDGGVLFRRGEENRTVRGDLAQILIDEIRKMK